MSDLIIDAPLLSCPDPSQFSQDDFQNIFLNFLTRLSDLSNLRLHCKSIRFWRDLELAEVLYEQNSYPFRHSLTAAFNELFDPVDFQLEDVNILAIALLERSMRLEDAGEIQEIIVSSCVLSDDPIVDRSLASVNHLCRLTSLALPIFGDGNEFSSNVYLVSRESDSPSESIGVACTVDMAVDSEGEYIAELPAISVRLPIYLGGDTFCTTTDLVKWWSAATSDAIIDSCGIQAGRTQQDIWSAITLAHKNMTVGEHFIATARALGFMHVNTKINRLLRVCADLVLRRNLADSHWLRDGMGPMAPQKAKGKWRAWRHDIDQEFHLHYWRDGDNIELANVVVHNDFSIE